MMYFGDFVVLDPYISIDYNNTYHQFILMTQKFWIIKMMIALMQ